MAKLKKIYISAGHNKRDTGAIGYVTENEETRKIADAVAKALNEKYEVITYRDTFEMSVWDTINEANAKNCDLFVEFHENAGGGDGAEVIIHNEGNQFVADAFAEQFKKMGQQWRRTIKDNEFWVLKYTEMIACIVEVAFVDNKKDIQDFDSDKEKERLAGYMADAIAKIEHLPKKKPADSHPYDIPVKVQHVRVGDSTPSARILMGALTYRKYYVNHPELTSNSKFTVKASNALKRLQKDEGIPQTGEGDKTTWPYILGYKS